MPYSPHSCSIGSSDASAGNVSSRPYDVSKYPSYDRLTSSHKAFFTANSLPTYSLKKL